DDAIHIGGAQKFSRDGALEIAIGNGCSVARLDEVGPGRSCRGMRSGRRGNLIDERQSNSIDVYGAWWRPGPRNEELRGCDRGDGCKFGGVGIDPCDADSAGEGSALEHGEPTGDGSDAFAGSIFSEVLSRRHAFAGQKHDVESAAAVGVLDSEQSCGGLI